MGRLFGTDGIRGVANHWPLTPAFVLEIGQAAAQMLRRNGGTDPTAVIGRDTRLSGHMLESALAAGLASQGVDVMLAGVIPTPGVAYLARTHGAQLGIVISASHNPFDHNGIKMFGGDGFKIPDEVELEIERLVLDDEDEFAAADAGKIGWVRDAGDWRQEYTDHLVQTWGDEDALRGRRILLDCANGATSEIAPQVFGRLGFDLVVMEHVPDGININEHYEYIYPELLRAAVLREKAMAGIAFDGDGDRVMLVDEKGGFINGDVALAILARDMQRQGLLTNHAVVGTPMSNWGLKASLEEIGARLEETAVGDRFVLQRMIEENYALGGEQSGHIITLRDGQTTGDGIYTALAVLKVAAGEPNQSLAALASCMREFPEYLSSIEVSSKPPLQTIPEVQDALKRLHAALGENIDVTLRYSGTESKLRLKIRAGEEHDPQVLAQEGEAFMAVAGQAIG
ncbi:MAG: phosphoglucosamine mutase [Chloroflexi bacterium]|nr:MAG: phosphoglucosamine mutase [Chloroflexota bacterium]